MTGEKEDENLHRRKTQNIVLLVLWREILNNLLKSEEDVSK
jgi:hypothetical protein